jgi:ADP-heptose:LPS heptosyltransferase
MRISYLVREGNSELVRTMSQINEMITYEPAHLSLTSTTYFSLLKRLRTKQFNVVFLLGTEFNLPRSALAIVTRAAIRIGFAVGDRSFPFVNCEVRLGDGARYEATKVQAFLTAIGMHGWEGLPGWSLPDQDVRWAKQMIHFHKPDKDVRLIAVDPGIGMGGHRLAAESFAYLVNQLSTRMSCQIMVVSNNLDKKRLQQFTDRVSTKTLGVQPQSVKESLALLSQSDLLISGNTDFFHFGVGMRIPSVGLFTRHDEQNWFPRANQRVQIMQGVKGQQLSVEEFTSKIDTLLHLSNVDS